MAIQSHVFENAIVNKFLELLRGWHAPVTTQELVGGIVLKVESCLSVHLAPSAVSNVF